MASCSGLHTDSFVKTILKTQSCALTGSINVPKRFILGVAVGQLVRYTLDGPLATSSSLTGVHACAVKQMASCARWWADASCQAGGLWGGEFNYTKKIAWQVYHLVALALGVTLISAHGTQRRDFCCTSRLAAPWAWTVRAAAGGRCSDRQRAGTGLGLRRFGTETFDPVRFWTPVGAPDWALRGNASWCWWWWTWWPEMDSFTSQWSDSIRRHYITNDNFRTKLRTVDLYVYMIT